MKILYLDLNDDNLIEDYSSNPNKYGGGRVFASAALQKDNKFFIAAGEKCFSNISNKNNCIITSEKQRADIVLGKRLKDIIPQSEEFDIFVYHRFDTVLNLEGLKGKQCCWAVGRDEKINPEMENLLLYDRQNQNSIVSNKTKIYDVTIGVHVPVFQEYQKEKLIFQCTRHEGIFGSIEVAQLCRKYSIPLVLAGPIQNGYPLMQYVDSNLIKYIGIISNSEKAFYYKKAMLTTYLHFWQTPFNLSAIESLSYGTPIMSTRNGFWPKLIKNSINGYIIETEMDFVESINNCLNIKQKDCYNSSLNYSSEKMVESFYSAFNNIIKNNKNKITLGLLG